MNASGRLPRVLRSVTRPSMPVRILLVVAFPLACLTAFVVSHSVESRAEAHDARRLRDAVLTVDQLITLRAALSNERIHEELGAPVSTAPSAMHPAPDPGYYDTSRVRDATDIALTQVALADRPFGHDDLIRLRRSADEGVLSPSLLKGRYDDLDHALTSALDHRLSAVRRSAASSGDTTLLEAVSALESAIDAFTASGELLTELNGYWYAAPFEARWAQSRLARAYERYTLVDAQLQATAISPVAALWSRIGGLDPRFQQAVEDALKGVASPATAPASNLNPRVVLAGGASRALLIGELPALASATVKDEATRLAQRAGSQARIATATAVSSLLISLVVMLWFGRSIVVPVRRLTDAARQVRDGELDLDPLALSGPPEIVLASRTFNDLVANLRLLDGKARALAECEFDDPLLGQTLPGRLGESLDRSVHLLSDTMRERERLQGRLRHEATHDPLTGILNRAAALDALVNAVTAADLDRPTAVMYLDLFEFKRVNDTYGHNIGDELLRHVATVMNRSVRDGDAVARLGGDEFLIITHRIGGGDEAVALAHRLLMTLAAPVEILGHDLLVRASAGIALVEQPRSEPLTVLHEANLALHRARETDSGGVAVFDEALENELRRRIDIEAALTEALSAGGQLSVYFQPIVDSVTERVVSMEALVRWNRTGHGFVSPADFIPIAEKSNLIIDLDRWVLAEATSQVARWSGESALARASVSVNVSGRHLLHVDFVPNVERALAESGLDPTRLIVEVTETSLISDLDRAAQQLTQLRAKGMRIAVDDFGTGYTSVAHLRALPIDKLKIDRSFVNGLHVESDRRLVQLVRDLAHALDIPTVVEGVETAEQLSILRHIGCDTIQGYLYSRPLPAGEFLAWAQQHTAALDRPRSSADAA